MCIRDSHLIEANHTYKNIDSNMNILHVHTKGRKLDTLEPVSYTHLDVYKRQSHHTHTASIFRNTTSSPTTRRAALITTASDAVSYTHLITMTEIAQEEILTIHHDSKTNQYLSLIHI